MTRVPSANFERFENARVSVKATSVSKVGMKKSKVRLSFLKKGVEDVGRPGRDDWRLLRRRTKE